MRCVFARIDGTVEKHKSGQTKDLGASMDAKSLQVLWTYGWSGYAYNGRQAYCLKDFRFRDFGKFVSKI